MASNQPVLFPEYAEPVQTEFPQVSSAGANRRVSLESDVRKISGEYAEGNSSFLHSSGPASHGLARHTDPDTSHAAALSVDVSQLERIYLETLRANPMGLTNEEIAERTGLPLNSISPRSKPLRDKNLIFDSTYRRPTSSGRSSIVWRSRL